MNANPRCLFNSDFASFLHKDTTSIFGALCDNYHGKALTTTREAWKSEIGIMRNVLSNLNDASGQIIFEYDIPRLGKRIDVVLLYRGIVFCVEFKVGEAGISEWINALNDKFPHWKVYISSKLTEAEYAEGRVNELLQENKNVTYSDSLHLGVSLRSFRAEKLSAFVHALLDIDPTKAAELYSEIKDKYPIVLTRDMEQAKKWLHKKVRGTERTGVLITKESARYKPLGIHALPSGDENAVHWFLEDKADTRSSNYLEDAATEIQVQGLELDYTCLLWDADMRYDDGKWRFYRFNGRTNWVEQIPNSEGKQELRKYMLNAYRVLLTRARSGMVICVPKGNSNKNPSGFWEDITRLPECYDGTYEYLKSLGIEEI